MIYLIETFLLYVISTELLFVAYVSPSHFPTLFLFENIVELMKLWMTVKYRQK
jgi:hypothetical protein